jgi:hydroxymethylbilane synthase
MALPPLRIGTRGSPLALAQAAELRTRLATAHAELAAPEAIEIVPIRTTGDRLATAALAEMGGKGLFTKEIEEALLAGTIDFAVHSMKDLPAQLPAGLGIVCHLPRADPRDALVARAGVTRLRDLPQGAVVGTSSPRRHAQLLYLRPDLRIVPLRGNVGTRLRKLASGEMAATLLAVAGLKRLGRSDAISAILEPTEILPAVAQGAIAIEIRADDARAHAWLAPLDDPATAYCLAAERALLATLDGSCRTPIAGLARLDGETLVLDAMVIQPDGGARHLARRQGHPDEAAALGADAGRELKSRAGANFFMTEPTGQHA